MLSTRNRYHSALLALLAVLGVALVPPPAAAEEFTAVASQVYRLTTDRPFEDVVEDAKFAIMEHNFRITGSNIIGEAIAQRTGQPFPSSIVIHFCNLEYAREYLQAAADFLIQMPCRIVIYQHDDKVVVETPLVPESDARVSAIAQRTNDILRTIAEFAVEG